MLPTDDATDIDASGYDGNTGQPAPAQGRAARNNAPAATAAPGGRRVPVSSPGPGQGTQLERSQGAAEIAQAMRGRPAAARPDPAYRPSAHPFGPHRPPSWRPGSSWRRGADR